MNRHSLAACAVIGAATVFAGCGTEPTSLPRPRATNLQGPPADVLDQTINFPTLSERVRLEVAILAADEAPLENAPPPHDAAAVTILVVAADTGMRRYVQECLRDRAQVRVLAAATVTEALTIAARDTPQVLVVDSAQSEILMALVHVPVVMLVDETPYGDRPAESRVRFLARPFTPGDLAAAVDALFEA